MTILVWHRDHPWFMDNSPKVLAEFPRGFTAVAQVTLAGDSPDEAFALTNSIDGPWVENVGMTPGLALTAEGRALLTRQGGIRSTSVGDIYTDTAPGSHRRWTIEGVGLYEF